MLGCGLRSIRSPCSLKEVIITWNFIENPSRFFIFALYLYCICNSYFKLLNSWWAGPSSVPENILALVIIEIWVLFISKSEIWVISFINKYIWVIFILNNESLGLLNKSGTIPAPGTIPGFLPTFFGRIAKFQRCLKAIVITRILVCNTRQCAAPRQSYRQPVRFRFPDPVVSHLVGFGIKRSICLPNLPSLNTKSFQAFL